jgi:hypothetical protein
MLFSFPLMAVIQAVSARTGCVTGHGTAQKLTLRAQKQRWQRGSGAEHSHPGQRERPRRPPRRRAAKILNTSSGR